MNLQRIRAMARKEWWHLLRDPRGLGLILLMPVMLLFLFGYAIRLDIQDAPIGVLQEAHDAQANALVAQFAASRSFRIVAYYPDRAALGTALQDGEIWAGLVVPHDYARRLAHGDAQLQLLLDGVDANTARMLRNYALALVRGYALSLNDHDPPLQIDERVWFNQGVESRIAIIPGLIALIMAVIGALMTSLTVAREMEQGNLVMLRTTPLQRGEFLLGKLLPYFVIGMGDLLLAVAVAVWAFDVPLRGSLWQLSLVSGLFLLVVMVQGALISIVAGNQLLASQMAMISTFLPAFLLSGFIFAIDNMPVVLQYLTMIVPARYLVVLSKAMFLKGVGLTLLWGQAAILLLVLLVLVRVMLTKANKLGLLK